MKRMLGFDSLRLCVILLFAVTLAYSMVPLPRPVTFKLLGGCSVNLTQHGDAFRQYWLTPFNYSVCKMPDGKFYFLNKHGECSPTEYTCTQKIPSFDVVKKMPSRSSVSEERQQSDMRRSYFAKKKHRIVADMVSKLRKSTEENRTRNLQSIGGKRRNLVLMLRFKDHKAKKLPSADDYNKLFNAKGGDPLLAPTGSIRDYYLAQSYGNLEIESTLTGWIDVSYTEQEAAGAFFGSKPCHGTCPWAKLVEAIQEGLTKWDAANSFREISKFDSDKDGVVDMFTIVHSGYGAEFTSASESAEYRIWSHRFSFTSSWYSPKTRIAFRDYNINSGLFGDSDETATIARIGVIAHEMAHYLGLPDLYDTDYSTQGIGNYDIMANSWGADMSQLYPQSFCGPTKLLLLGWANAKVLTSPEQVADSYYRLESFQENGEVFIILLSHKLEEITKDPELLRTEAEFILLENRRPEGPDKLLSGGILVWHVDAKMLDLGNNLELDPSKPSTWNSKHFAFRLIQSDGGFDLERGINQGDSGDWFTSSSDSIGDETRPSLNTYANAMQGINSGYHLSDFSDSKTDMTFRFRYRPQNTLSEGAIIGITVGVSSLLVFGLLYFVWYRYYKDDYKASNQLSTNIF